MNKIKAIVHNRLRIQRGQALVGMIFSTLTVVGVYRESIPMTWWMLVIIGGTVYLGLAWLIGLVDEKTQMFRYEQQRMSEMNPQVNAILESVKRIEGAMNDEA